MLLISDSDARSSATRNRVRRWAPRILIPLAALAIGVWFLVPRSVATPACTKTWDRGAATNNWSDAANWAPDGVPGASDVVCLGPANGSTEIDYTSAAGTTSISSIQVSGGEVPLNISGGELDINDTLNNSTITTLTQTGGTLGGNSVVNVGTFLWTGGQQLTPNGSFGAPGTGATIVTGSMTIDRPQDGNPLIDAFNPEKDLNRRLRLQGSTNVLKGNNGSGGSVGYLDIFGQSGKLEVASGATLQIRQDQDILGTGLGVVNQGTIVKQAGQGTATSVLQPPLDQDGTLAVGDGTLRINGNGINTDTGTWNIAGGSTMQFDGGTHTLSGDVQRDPATTGTASAIFSGGTWTLNGAYAVQSTTISGATASFNGTTIPGAVSISSGRGDFNQNTTFDSLTETGGVLGGTATVTVPTFLWTGGQQDTPNGPFSTAGTGATVVTTSMTIDRPQDGNPNIDAFNPEKDLNRRLRLSGATNVLKGNNGSGGNQGSLDLFGLSGKLEVMSGATLQIRQDQDILGSGIGIVNQGAIVKQAGQGTAETVIQPPLDQDATLTVEDGSMKISGAGFDTDLGVWNIAGGATMNFNGGTHTLSGDIQREPTTTGTASATFSGGTWTMNGGYAAQSTTITGGTNAFNGSTTTGPVTISGGRGDFNQNTTFDSLTETAGVLGGTATVTVPTFLWTGGQQDTPGGSFGAPGTGGTIVTNAMTIDRPQDGNPNIDASNPSKDLNRLLRLVSGTNSVLKGNNGSSGGTGALDLFGQSGKLEVLSGAVLQIRQDQDIVGGALGIVNQGTIVKQAGQGTAETVIQPPLDQDGTLGSEDGTVRIDGNGVNTDTGTWNIAGGATMKFDSGTHTLSGSIQREPATTGTASAIFSGGTWTMNGSYSVQSTSITGGTNVFNGSTGTGPLSISGGRGDFNTPISPDSLTQTNGTLGGTATVTVPTFLWTGGGQDTPNGPSSTPGTGATVVTTSMTIDRPQDGNPSIDAPTLEKDLSRRLTLQGPTNVLKGNNGSGGNQGSLFIFGLSGKLEVSGTSTLQIRQDQDILGGGIGIVNQGTIVKQAGQGTAETLIQPPLDQDGTLTVEDGSMRISGNGFDTDTGVWNIAGGTTMNFAGGTHTLSGTIHRETATTGTASAIFSSGTWTMNGLFSVQSTSISGGNSAFNGVTTTGPLSISGGRGDFNTSVSPDSLTQTGGTLGGTATVTVPTFLWTGGAQDTPNGPFGTVGSGATVVTTGMTIDRPQDGNPLLDASNPEKDLSRDLQLQSGSVNVLKGNNGSGGNIGDLFVFGLSGKLENAGTLDIRQDQDIIGGGIGVVNTGTITKPATFGTGLTRIQPPLTQSGTLDVQTGTVQTDNLQDYNGGTHTLGGGIYHLAGTLAIPGGDIQTLAARLDMDGTGAQVDNTNTGTANDGLNNFATVGATGDLRILNGKNLTAPQPPATGPFTNNGSITVGSGSTFTPTGGLQNNGTLRGSGTVSGNVTNAGTVSPGSSPGTLSISGDYTQTSAGTLEEEINGTSSGQFDKLAVSGAVALGGTLDIVNGYTTTIGDTIPFLTYASRTGDFSSITGDRHPGTDQEYDTTYGATIGNLVVSSLSTPTLQLPASTVSTTEGNSGTHVVNFPVTLSEPTNQTVTVHYATSDGSANSSDYTGTSGTLTFLPGETSHDIPVTIAGDALNEADETITMTLSSASNALLPGTPSQTITISNDDALPTISVTDLRDVPEGGTVDIPVHLSAVSGRDVTVHWQTQDDSGGAHPATAGSDYTAQTPGADLVIPAGQTVGHLSIPTTDDSDQEPTETFVVHLLDSPGNGTLDSTARDTLVNIVDNDPAGAPAPVTPHVSIDDVSLAEGNSGTTNARFVVTLDQSPTSDVGFDYATSNGSASAGSDYAATSGHKTIPAGGTTAVIDVPVNGDTAVEPDETFSVTLSNLTNAASSNNTLTGTGTILNDDQPPQVVVQQQQQQQPPQQQTQTPQITVEQQKANDLPVVIGKTPFTFAFNVVGVPLSCPHATSICAGQLRLTQPLKGKGKHKLGRKAAAKSKDKILGRATFFVRPGEQRIISVRLYGSASVFKRAKKLSAKVSAFMRDGKVVSRQMTFGPPKKRKKH